MNVHNPIAASATQPTGHASLLSSTTLGTPFEGQNTDELTWMIDNWRETRDQVEAQIRITDAIDMRPDVPGPVEVRLTELPDLRREDYYNGHDDPFTEDRRIGIYVRELIEGERTYGGRADFDDWALRVLKQGGALLEMFEARVTARVAWFEEAGYLAAEEAIDDLTDRMIELAWLIVRHPVESLRDIALKVEFLEELGTGDGDGEMRMAALVSMKTFACGGLAVGGASAPSRTADEGEANGSAR